MALIKKTTSRRIKQMKNTNKPKKERTKIDEGTVALCAAYVLFILWWIIVLHRIFK
jgi:hypothetical protein